LAEWGGSRRGFAGPTPDGKRQEKAIFSGNKHASMEKSYFFVRLNPIRPDFVPTMTSEERAIMLTHSNYWREWQARGCVVVFGPVSDPAGAFGMGVVGVQDESELKEMIAGDPAKALTRIEYFPMRAVLPQ
jgi:hypothetical protein